MDLQQFLGIEVQKLLWYFLFPYPNYTYKSHFINKLLAPYHILCYRNCLKHKLMEIEEVLFAIQNNRNDM